MQTLSFSRSSMIRYPSASTTTRSGRQSDRLKSFGKQQCNSSSAIRPRLNGPMDRRRIGGRGHREKLLDGTEEAMAERPVGQDMAVAIPQILHMLNLG